MPESKEYPLLDARLVVEKGAFRLDAAVRIERGEVVALLGPNGAGKTTAVRALAGLEPLAAGHVRLAGQLLDSPDGGLWTAPEHRDCAVVFPDLRLFPHLTAVQNVAFGPRRRGVPRAAALTRAQRLLAEFGLARHTGDRPSRLSGGQAQRVALARALAVEPLLLLADEPLSALDVDTRAAARVLLRRRLTGPASGTLLITHDPLDALTLADRLVILERGRVTQEGTPEQVAADPRTDYVARLLGPGGCPWPERVAHPSQQC